MRGEHLDLSERVEVTTDDATAAAADALVAVLQGHGFAVERRTFIRNLAEEPRRVVLLALGRPLPALVPLVAPPTALPGLTAALVAALYPVRRPDRADAVLATVQLKAEGAFVSVNAHTGPELLDVLLALAGRVRRVTWAVWPSAVRERRIAYLDGQWFSE